MIDVMKPKSIKEAIIEVLKVDPNPLTPSEIYKNILSKNLFSFNSKTPINIVQATLRKNCEGISIKKSADKKVFKIVGNGKYSLL